MIILSIIISCVLLGLILAQAISVIWFVMLFFRRPGKPVPDRDLPHASILLPLRGADPKLAESLKRLLRQDYPSYDIRIVIDRREDPAWDVVERVIHQTNAENIHMSAIERRSTTCSPQCTALIQAVQGIDDRCEVVAIIDGDVLTHPTWLRELVTPLLDSRIGISYGNRWFLPPDANWGSLVRYLWNAAAVVPMYILEIPWGGTFAIRRSVLYESGLFEAWSRSLVHDAPAPRLLKKLGLRLKFVPSLMMVNSESCELAFSRDFVKRQLTWTRTYHPQWWQVLLYAVGTSTVLCTAVVLLAWGLAAQQFAVTFWTGCGLAIYFVGMMAFLGILEIGVRRVIRMRGEEPGRPPRLALLKLPLAIALTQGVYLVTALLATFNRSVSFRGITYHILGPFDIRVITDRPFEQCPSSGGHDVST